MTDVVAASPDCLTADAGGSRSEAGPAAAGPGLARRILGVAGWAIPGIVLGVAGVQKLVFGAPAQPVVLGALSATAFQRMVLAVAVLECLVAVALVFTRGRRIAALVGGVLLTSFSLLAAASAGDHSFLANCGCGVTLPAETFGYGAPLMVLRNTVLVAMLASCARRGRRLVWMLAAIAPAGFVLALSESIDRRSTKAALNGVLRDARLDRVGWRIPDVRLRAVGGDVASAYRLLRVEDCLIFYSRDCPHCHEAVAYWQHLQQDAAQRGGRLVMVDVDASSAEPVAVPATMQSAVPDAVVCRLVERRDLEALGVTMVPCMIRVGRGMRVDAKTSTFRHTSSFAAMRRLVGERAAAELVLRQLDGADASMQLGELRRSDGCLSVEVAGAEPQTLLVVGGNPYRPEFVELALLLGGDGRIRAVRAIDWQLGFTGADDPAPHLEALPGMTLEEAAAYGAHLHRDARLGYVWIPVSSALERALARSVK
jgi:hypothetical protein